MAVVRVDEDLEHQTAHAITEMLEALAEVESNFSSIDNLLYAGGTDSWAGIAQRKCAVAHEAIKLYAQVLRPYGEQMKDELSQLVFRAENFKRKV